RPDPPSVLPHLGCAFEDHDELVPARALLREHLSLTKVDLVRDPGDLFQALARQPREQRHLADQLDLAVAAEAHGATLRPWCSHCNARAVPSGHLVRSRDGTRARARGTADRPRRRAGYHEIVDAASREG